MFFDWWIQVFNVQLYLGQSSQLTSIFFRRAPTSLVLLTILDPDDHFEESQCSHHFRQSKEWEYELHAQLLTLLMLCAADNIAQSCPSVTKKMGSPSIPVRVQVWSVRVWVKVTTPPAPSLQHQVHIQVSVKVPSPCTPLHPTTSPLQHQVRVQVWSVQVWVNVATLPHPTPPHHQERSCKFYTTLVVGSCCTKKSNVTARNPLEIVRKIQTYWEDVTKVTNVVGSCLKSY